MTARSKPAALAILAVLVPAGCASPPATAPKQPDDWDVGVRLPEPTNLSSDPNVVEIALDARVASVELQPGLLTDAWTYAGTVPGPLIRVRRGQRLIVHFTNNLPEATTIHWHGLRIPPEMDGMPDNPYPPVPPGGTFDYDFVVPDAGLYWYHPHVHSSVQEPNGLYGALVVEDDSEPAGLGDELVLVLSDVALDATGAFEPADSGGDLGTLFGREGNLMLVNGRSKPVIKARPGVAQRWRIVNAAKTRYFQIGLDGQSFVRIGGDGGLVASAAGMPAPASQTLVLTPGQRADAVLVPAGDPGSDLALSWIPYDRGYGSTFGRPVEEIATVHLEGDPVVPPAVVPATGRAIAPLDITGATAVALTLTENDMNGQFALGINGVAFNTEIHAHIGETQVWTVTNTLDFAHPFHIHGFFFQVLDDGSGAAPSPLEWRDTANVPVQGQLQLAIRLDDRPGMWMFHCHILDHADAGMMAMLMIDP
jgi:FtsP/CotA-like multicopper oxidase with cupredoxin domain